MSLRPPTVAYLLFTFVIGPVCDVAQTSDGGIIAFTFIKALYVMSLRRPTVAFLLKALYVVSLRCPTVASFSLFLFVHLSRRRFRHPIGPYLCSVEFQADYRRFPFLFTRYASFIYCALRN